MRNRTEQNRKTARQAGDAPEGTSHNAHTTLAVTKRDTKPPVLAPWVPPGFTMYKQLDASHCIRTVNVAFTPSKRTPCTAPLAARAAPPPLVALRALLKHPAVVLLLLLLYELCLAAKQLHRLNFVLATRRTPACQKVDKAPAPPRHPPCNRSFCVDSASLT